MFITLKQSKRLHYILVFNSTTVTYKHDILNILHIFTKNTINWDILYFFTDFSKTNKKLM